MATKASTNIIKTTILIVVITLLAAGVYFSISRINSKPPQAPTTNQFVDDLNTSIDNMCELMDEVEKSQSASTLNCIGDEYNSYSNRQKLYLQESLITQDEYNTTIEKLNGSFAVKYANYYLNRFKSSPWNASDIKNVRTIVEDLASFQRSNAVVSELGQIIDLYDQVLAFAQHTSDCHTKEVAQERIQKAKAYAANECLKNNRELCALLRSMPQRLGEAHHNYVYAKVDLLKEKSKKRNVSQSEFESFYMDVSREVNYYAEARSQLYGDSVPSPDQIRKIMNRIKENYNENH